MSIRRKTPEIGREEAVHAQPFSQAHAVLRGRPLFPGGGVRERGPSAPAASCRGGGGREEAVSKALKKKVDTIG